VIDLKGAALFPASPTATPTCGIGEREMTLNLKARNRRPRSGACGHVANTPTGWSTAAAGSRLLAEGWF
jgi:hypothetical protein